MTLLRSALSALACAALVCTPALAQWTWRDANGRVVASDRPPPASVPERDILQRPAGSAAPRAPAPPPMAAASAAAAASGAAARPVDADLESRKRRTDEQAAAKRRADEQAAAARREAEERQQAAQRAENCARARDALRTLQDGGRIARVNAAGEREFMDDAQRARELARVQGVVANDCR